jgi:hypothetical protein
MDVQEVEEHLRASLHAAANRRPQLNVEQVRRALDTCVVEALNLQLEYYASLPNYRPEWVPALALRTIDSAIGSFPLLTDGEPFRARLEQTVRHYLQGRRKAKAMTAPQPVIPESEPLPHRLPATIHSPSAARKLEAYLRNKGIGLTEFAIRAQTTDRTLRSFRRTGKLRRDIFDNIAKAMGTTREALLS